MSEEKQLDYYERPELSVSKFKQYWACPSRAYAVDQGRWDDGLDDSEAIAIGSYVDAVLTDPSAIQENLEKYSEVFFKSVTVAEIQEKLTAAGVEFKKSAKKTELEKLAAEHEINITVEKSAKRTADALIKRVKSDELMMALLEGEKQIEWYGEINGVPFKCRPDNVNREMNFISDLKTIKGVFAKDWNKDFSAKAYLWELRGYDIQLATYRHAMEMPDARGFLAMTGKDDSIGVGEFPESKLQAAFQFLWDNVNQVETWRKGIDLERCGRCDYCLATMDAELIESKSEFSY